MAKAYIEILKYLYDNDNGEFVDVTKAFKEKDMPSHKHIEKIYKDLKDYIETESVNNYRGVIFLEDKTIPKTPLLKARINQKGRDYYFEHRNKNITLTVNKRNFIISLALFILSVLTFYFTIINPIKFKEKEIVINESNFPNPVMCLENKTSDTIFFYYRQDFIMWFPETAIGQAPNLIGKYEFVIDSTHVLRGMPFILPNSKLQLEINILNKEKFFPYYLQNENDLMLWLRTKPYHLHSTENFPFNKKWLSQYCLPIVIDAELMESKK